MQTLTKLLAVSLAAIIAGSASAQSEYATSFDGLIPGNLNGQDGWVAQTQWKADGLGTVANDTSGAFIRAHQINLVGSNTVGESITQTVKFTLSAAQTPSNDIDSFEEGILTFGIFDEVGKVNFSPTLSSGIYYFPSTGELELRSGLGGGSETHFIDLASDLTDPTTWTLSMKTTKKGEDKWDVVTTLTGGTLASPLSLSYSVSGVSGLENTPSGVAAGFQTHPSSLGSAGVDTGLFSSVTIEDYSLTVASGQ
ncbi:MAG: hypothetical protein AAGJ81_02350 [Verrucomicrobiota bacterium]